MELHAILTAGGKLPRDLAALAPSGVKALLPVGGRTLLVSAAGAVRECGEIEQCVAVGNADVKQAVARLPAEFRVEYLPEGPTVIDNVYSAFLHCGGEEHDYLVLSPDVPFITGRALSGFIAAARESCEIGAPVVNAEDFLLRFPQAPNFFTRLDGRAVTMGSCFYLNGVKLKQNIPLMQDFYKARKRPHVLAAMLGLPIVLAFIFGQLSLSALERRMGRLTGAVCRGVPTPYAELAYDVDNRVNYDYAVAHLSIKD